MTSASGEVADLAKRPDPGTKSHPEMAAGGYARDDGSVEFYQRVVAVLPEGGLVLDLGAGRGAVFDNGDKNWRDWLVRLGKRYSRRIGVDVDPAVLKNPELDEAKVIEPGKPLPFPDATFDLVLCDWVVEHVEDPASFAAEIRRVLKVGGWFCARTPNRWSYFSVGARVLSGPMQARVLKLLQPSRKEEDVFPKFYRLNTLGEIAAAFGPPHWVNATYTHNPDPSYHGNMAWLRSLIILGQKLLPDSLGTVVLIFARRVA